MLPRPRLVTSVASAVVVFATACGAGTVDAPSKTPPVSLAGIASPMAVVASVAPDIDAQADPANETLVVAEPPWAGPPLSVPAACAARSGRLEEKDDAWNDPAQQAATRHCELGARGADLGRILEGALPLDPGTAAHVARIFRRGRLQGRRPNAFGLVGDSMTLTGSFLRPFAASSDSPPLPTSVVDALTIDVVDDARTVLQLFRGSGRSALTAKPPLDSFVAPRAAKVGVSVGWALAPRAPREPSPLDEMVRDVSPAYAVVLYGANDAMWMLGPLDVLVRRFEDDLSDVVSVLEARGVVPVLTTVPRHMHEGGWPDTASFAGAGSNERFAAQATALSAAVADLACSRGLPLIDLRWSLEPLLNHGVGPDGVHLSVHPRGGGVLDESGLECGSNVRNLVTLRELALVVDAASAQVGGSDVW